MPPFDPQRPWLAAYADGVPADIDPPDRPLSRMLEASVERFTDRPALDFLGAATSYRQLGAAVARAAGALHRLGVRPGMRVALVMPNCPQHVVAFYAVLRLGGIVVEHNPLYTPDELQVQFADHDAEVAICWSTVAGMVAGLGPRVVLSVDLAAGLPLARRLALKLPVPAARATRRSLGPVQPPTGTLSWERTVAEADPLPAGHPHPDVHDVAALQYTGGTTGTPKGAILTHANLAANTAQSRAWAPSLVDGQETFLAVLPLFHAYGLTLCLTTAVSMGARLVLLPRFDLDQALAAIARTRPTFLPGVPPIYARLAETAPARKVDLRSVKVALSGAMALPPDLVERWEDLTGGFLIEGYGMTETSPISVGNPVARNRRPGCIGVPYPSTRVRIVDPDDPQRDVPPGAPGELLIQGPQVFAGYWNRPAETAATLLPGGWIRTGDIVEALPDGFLRMVDRAKDLIITGGFNVYPGEVEDVLRRHPDVADAAVVGIPSADGSEVVVAAVVARPGASPDPGALRAHCREHLAGYKTPRRIHLVADLPRSIIGKALHRQVRDQVRELEAAEAGNSSQP
ncbi:MAG TPA: long-chain-fatty-acid--CoA ligase [Kineosporiaceae bacterium]|nr:long-chain-fatty-acid--CoA ligase [Kineosporiaceae bacterium]